MASSSVVVMKGGAVDALSSFTGTETIIVEQIYGGRHPRPWQVIVASLAFACLAIAASRHFFVSAVGVLSIFLCVLGLMPTLSNMVDFRKERHRLKQMGLQSALGGQTAINLALSILALFGGVMLAYGGWALLLPANQVVATFETQLAPWLGMTEPGFHVAPLAMVLLNNLLVALGVVVLTLLYRNGGALLVLCWNASVWGAAFAYFARLQFGDGGAALKGWLSISAAVFPHVLLEATGYVLMVLVGLFLLRLIVRFTDAALDRRALIGATLRLAGLGVSSLTLAAVIETSLAPSLVDMLSGKGG